MFTIQLGLVIASKHPKKLSEFYAFATNGEIRPGKSELHWRIVHKNGMTIHLYKPSLNRPCPEKGRASSLCLEQPPSLKPLLSIEDWAGTLILRGAKSVQSPKLESFGAEIWMMDPEDNHFLLLIPSINS